jgi:hypothetical protein
MDCFANSWNLPENSPKMLGGKEGRKEEGKKRGRKGGRNGIHYLRAK